MLLAYYHVEDFPSAMSKCRSCGFCRPDLKLCSGCLLVVYCCRECQAGHRGRHKFLCKAASRLTQEALKLPHSQWLSSQKFFETQDLLEQHRQMLPRGPAGLQANTRPGAVAYAEIQRTLQAVLKAVKNATVEDLPSLNTLVFDRVPWLLRRRATDFLDKHHMQSLVARLHQPDEGLSGDITQLVAQLTGNPAEQPSSLSRDFLEANDYDQILKSPLQLSWNHRSMREIVESKSALDEQLRLLQHGCLVVLNQVQDNIARL